MNQLNSWFLRTMTLGVLAAILFPGCQSEVNLEVVAGVDACHRCSMVIDQVKQACGYIESGEQVTFDSPGCLLVSYEQLRTQGEPLPEEVFFVDYHAGTWHSAQTTAFLMTEHIPTVMNAGVVCFATAEAAEAMKEHASEEVTDWIGFRTARGIPDREVEVTIDPNGMSPESIDVSKGELVLWRVSGNNLTEDLEITVKGYPEAEAIIVPATGEEVSFRIMATRPGTGFPVIETGSGKSLGRMRVSGAHTLDEEAM
ncbi:MAG TPA: hypothetical protein VMY18_01965 [Acidobacteriota bacterium]|nr:hypothetical protein [Acidobacteriota bacterium]